MAHRVFAASTSNCSWSTFIVIASTADDAMVAVSELTLKSTNVELLHTSGVKTLVSNKRHDVMSLLARSRPLCRTNFTM